MIEVTTLPALEDNYIYLISNDKGEAVVVDPGEAAPVLEVLRERSLQLSAILITHLHADHIDGLPEVCRAHPQAVVYGPKEMSWDGLIVCGDGDTLSLLSGELKLQVMHTPGHCDEHITFYGEGLLFCGDVLFVGGCGRVIEGAMEKMHQSLQKIAALPEDSLVYCGHEYTLSNLSFAKAVDAHSEPLERRIEKIQSLVAAGKESVPSLLSEELETNPFLRVEQKTIIDAASAYANKQLMTPSDVFTTLRLWKNSF